MKKIVAVLVLLFLYVQGICIPRIYNITDFGAKPDGKTINTSFIQKAIDVASQAGGGMVEVPLGQFVTGQLFLRSGVELYLKKGATLLGSTNRLDYITEQGITDGLEAYNGGEFLALIVARDMKNISITGKGVINGRGSEVVMDLIDLLGKDVLKDPSWKTSRPHEFNRPMLLAFVNCTNVKVSGITLKNAACWVQTYKQCTGVTIDSIRVISTDYWNNDGIDIDNSRNVKITNSFINAADDGICLKSGSKSGSCENIYVANCTIRSSASAFKIGTASFGSFKNIKVRNLTIYDTYRSAIAIEAVDGAILQDVDIQNVKAANTGNALFIRLGHRNKDDRYSEVKNIYIAHVNVEVPTRKPDLGYPIEGPTVYPVHHVFPASITGLSSHPVENVTLEDIHITYQGGSSKNVPYVSLDSLYKVPEKEHSYPEFSMFGELPSWGLYVRHVKGLNLKDITLSFVKDDPRPAIVMDDVNQLKIDHVNIPSYSKLPIVILKDVPHSSLKSLTLPLKESEAIKEIK